MSGLIALLTNQTIDVTTNPESFIFPNGAGLKAWGTWGGASVILQTLAPQSSPAVWITVTDLLGNVVTFTANTQITLDFLVPGESLRAVQSGSTGTTTLNLTLQEL